MNGIQTAEVVAHQPNGSLAKNLDEPEIAVSQPSAEDKKKLLQWNAEKPQRLEVCVHDLVRETVRRQPNSLAVCAWDGDLTYAELDQKANQLAHHLISIGVGPEVMVGLCLSKSKIAPITMLAILYAGGVVVPLGVEHPLLRIEVILNDSQTRIILADAEQKKRLAALDRHMLAVDDEWLAQLPPPSTSSLPSLSPSSPAWVIYTSGSTGIPKGVLLDHGGISTVLKAHGAVFKHFGPGTRRLQFANHVFDVAIADLIGSFIFGVTVCIPSESERVSNLSQFMSRMGITFAYFTATMASFISPSSVPGVKTVLIGGEKVNPWVVERWLGFADVHIAYGPSECTIHAFHSKALTHMDQASTIGFPLTSAPWVVDPDDYNQLVPVGDVGELLIEGVALSRGYLGDPEKTAAAFPYDPAFISQLGLTVDGRRMYRTGDLVRQNETDGSITFVSRKDTQIKISGQRVETSEIESWVLQSLPDIHSAVVDLIPLGHDGGKPTLALSVEFDPQSPLVVARPSLEPQPLPPSEPLRQAWSRLREALAKVVPRYMIPSIFVPMTKLPLTITGKTDRRRLQELVRLRPLEELTAYNTTTETDDPPRSEIEVILQKVWAETLCLPQTQIGRNDDLFRLGADSISAMRVVNRTRPHKLHLTVANIFESPTIAALAEIASTNASSYVPPAKAYKPFSLIDPLRKDAIIEAITRGLKIAPDNRIVDAFPSTDFQNLCVCANLMRQPLALQHFFIKGTGPHSIEQLRKACERFLNEVEGLRSVFTFHEGVLLQIVLERNDSIVACETEEELDVFAEKLVEDGVFPAMALGQPVVNIAILSQKQTENHCILMRTSHGVYDGMSLPFLWKHLKCAIEDEPTPSKAMFAEFTADLADRATPEAFEYWRDLFDGLTIQAIPGAPPPSKYAVFQKTLTRPKQVPAPTSLPSGITPAIVVKAAWALVLRQFLGTEDVFFGHNTSGRNVAHPNVADAIGCCADYVPVRVAFDSQWTGADLLRLMADQQIASARFEGLGIRQIIQKCTNWAESTRMHAVINFPYFGPGGIQIGPTQYAITKLKRIDIRDTTELSILCIQHPKVINLVLGYAGDYFTKEYADGILTALAETVTLLATTPEKLLTDVKLTVTPNQVKNLGSVSSTTTTMHGLDNGIKHSLTNGLPNGHANGLADGLDHDEDAGEAVDLDVKQAWESAVGHRRGVDSERDHGEKKLWDTGADVIDFTNLMHLLQERGFTVDLEDVVDSPTLRDLSKLCLTRRNKAVSN